MPIPLLIALYVLFPALVLYLCARYPAVDKVGAVVICYLGGILLGNVGVLPEGASAVQEGLTEVCVALSLPLLLFSMDVRRWIRVAGKALLSLLLAVVAIVAVASVAHFLVLADVEEGWQVAGMAIGVYTGGTPNVAAIKTALGVDPTLFIVVHTYDTLLGAAYILFCVTVARRVFGLFLSPFAKPEEGSSGVDGSPELDQESIGSYRGIFGGRVLLGLLGALTLSAAIVGVSLLIGTVVPDAYSMAVLILAITTLALASSFVGPVRRIDKTFQLGMYIIYVFCFGVGSMARFETFVDIDPAVLAYITTCVFGTMIIHAALCRLFKVDVDTFIITSVAAVCSPPFVPVVAGALRNRMIVLSGLTTGIIGYAIGNYLGITVALALRSLGG